MTKGYKQYQASTRTLNFTDHLYIFQHNYDACKFKIN